MLALTPCHDAGATVVKSAAKSAARPAAMPAAKPQFSFDIADDGGLLDGAHGANAHSSQTTPYTHLQQHSSTHHLQLGRSAAAPAFKFDIDDDDVHDYDLGGSSAQRDDRIISNQHASTSDSAGGAAPSVAGTAAAALPAAKPSSAVCMQRAFTPKRQASSHAPSAAQSQPGFQSGPGGPFQKSLPAVCKAQQPQLKKAPNSFKPPRKITTAAAAGAKVADGAADEEAEMGNHMAGPSSRQPLLRLRRAGQAAAHAVPHAVPHAVRQAVGKPQGSKDNNGALV